MKLNALLAIPVFIILTSVLSLPVLAAPADPAPSASARLDALTRLRELHKEHLPAEVHEEACALLLTLSYPAQETSAETRISKGSVEGAEFTFTKVSHPKAGEGWRDPSRLVWYDVAPQRMRHQIYGERQPEELTAEEYCQKLGLRLPTRGEFEQLGLYMGATRDTNGKYSYKGYQPRVMPNLEGRWFWSSSVHPVNPGNAFVFSGGNGVVGGAFRYGYGSVRCVGR